MHNLLRLAVLGSLCLGMALSVFADSSNRWGNKPLSHAARRGRTEGEVEVAHFTFDLLGQERGAEQQGRAQH